MDPSYGLAARLRAALFAPVDAAGLVWFRVAFGGIMLWEMLRYLSYGWIGEHYADPAFHFSYFGWDWVPQPGQGAYVLAVALAGLAAAVMTGAFFRLTAPLFFVGFAWFFLLEQAKYLNHLYLACLFALILAFLPAHRFLSVDAWRRPQLRSATVPAWSLWILRFQMGLVYFYAGVAKLNGDWLQGEPMRDWLAERAHYPVFGPLLDEPAASWVFSYSGMLFDLFVPFLLLWRRTRIVALGGVFFFHISNEYLFSIGIFPYMASAVSLVFLDPSWPRKAFPVLFRDEAQEAPSDAGSTSSGRQGLVMGLLALWVGAQVLMPLRHHLYPGNVSWTEEGHLYAWHMKLRSKSGRARFHLHDPDSGESWTVRPAPLLTARQLRKMQTRPDLAHQFAKYLAKQAQAEGHDRVEVRVDMTVSLNGRPHQALIDPDVDLAAEPRSLWPKPWLLPLTEPLPTGRWAWADRMSRPRAPDISRSPPPPRGG